MTEMSLETPIEPSKSQQFNNIPICSNGVHPKYHKESAQSIISIHILTSECTLCPALELDMPGTF